MSLYTEWKNGLEGTNTNQKEREMFWNEYFENEKKAYQEILKNNENIIEGKVSDLAKRFKMTPVIFMGFLDGVSESLNKDLPSLDTIDEDTQINLDINFEKLLYNMHKAKAKWLYELEEWDEIFPEEKQFEIAEEYRKGRTIRKGPKIGRNEPCPCGSGKKYKNCHGKRKPIDLSGTK